MKRLICMGCGMRAAIIARSHQVRSARATRRSARPPRSLLAAPQARWRALCGWLARPDHKLEGREVPFTGIERGTEQGFALPGGGIHSAGENERMSVHDETFLGPEIEMADPHLLID